MFDPAKYLQSNVTVHFPDQRTLLDDQSRFDAALRGFYHPSQPVFDGEQGSQSRALLFSSRHGFSQIVITASSVVLNGSYSPDWQLTPTRIQEYLNERVGRVFNLIKLMPEPLEILFSGVIHRVQMPSSNSDAELVNKISKLYLTETLNTKSLSDVVVRTTQIIEDCFFSNIAVQNYRLSNTPISNNVLPQSNVHAFERGVDVTIDFNSRHSFNEDRGFANDLHGIRQMLGLSFVELNERISEIARS